MGKHKYSIPKPTSKMNLEPFPEANPIPKSTYILIPWLVTQTTPQNQNSSLFFGILGLFAPVPQEPAAFGRHQLRVGGSKWDCEASVQTEHKGMKITAGMRCRSFFFPAFFQEGISSQRNTGLLGGTFNLGRSLK